MDDPELGADRRRILALGAVALVALTGFGAAGWFVLGADLGRAATGDVSGAAGYRPTSKWIAKGVDPDVTTFGFGAHSAPADDDGPELSEPELRQFVNGKQNELMPCYADALKSNPDLKGRVDMEYGVLPDGTLGLVEVTGSTLESKPVEDCLVQKSRGWKFPRTHRDALLKFDTNFTFVYE